MKPQVEWFKQAIPYLQKYREKCFVIKIGGSLFEKEPDLRQLVESISALYHVGIQIVLVHGGGPQLNELSLRLGMKQTMLAGKRVTSSETLELAKMVYAGKLNTDFVALLENCEIPSVGLSGLDGSTIVASRRPPVKVRDDAQASFQEVDFGWVGDVERVEPKLLKDLCSRGYVPVLCCLAGDLRGQILNVNADTIAQHVAVTLQAEKLIAVSSVPGILKDVGDPKSLVSYADIQMIETMKKDGLIQGGMLPKVDACVAAIRGGVKRAHIISGVEEGSLLTEVFTNEGCGTLIVEKIERNGNGH